MRLSAIGLAACLTLLFATAQAWGQAPNSIPANEWTRLDKARIGTRTDIPLVYDAAGKRFLALGGNMDSREYPKPHPYDDLGLDLAGGQWENLFPAGKDWGEKFGDAKAPGWKTEYWTLTDAEGATRPNMGTYRSAFYYNQYAWDGDAKRVYFFARGSTFCYDPAAHAWKDLAPTGMTLKGGPLLWGTMAYDPTNKKLFLFGGGNILSPRGDPGTWTYDPAPNAWSELKFTSAALDGPIAKADELHAAAKRLAEAVRARYYRCELPADKAAKLDEAAAKLAADLGAFSADLDAAKAKTDAQETLQIDWAAPVLARCKAAVDKLKPLAAGAISVEAIKAADAAREALVAVSDALAIQPPQRARSPLAYDAAARQIVLFGGDQLDRLLGDTWVFDCQTNRWIQKRAIAGQTTPAPRGGHALVYLPKAKRVLLFGGFTYTSDPGYCASQYAPLPFEMWTYDPAANLWTQLKTAGKGPGLTTAAAVGEDDLVAAVVAGREPSTWLFKADMGATAPAAAAKPGDAGKAAAPATVGRKGPFVPEFYDEAPAPDPAAAAARLKSLPANTWTRLTPPRLPNIDRCWGTAIYSPDHDVIMHWSGGHSSHGGTEVIRYHPGIDRWDVATASEQPLDFDYSNDGTPGQWSFKHRPWMTGHTYHSYGYDSGLKRMLFCGKGDRTYLFDPELGDWEPRTIPQPFTGDMYTATVCATPKGAVVWAQMPRDTSVTGLWRMNAEKAAWEPLPLKGKLPDLRPDYTGLAYDSKRDRLLHFSLQLKGDVVAYDLASGEAKALGPTGRELAVVPSRETAYVPEADRVIVGAHVEGRRWPVYDCAKNAWQAVELAGADPVGNSRFNNSMGLMYDPNRKLVWALGQHSEVSVLRFAAP